MGIIESHNGFIDFDSRKGHGTEFRIYLPAAGSPSLVMAETPDLLGAIAGGTETILFVEDEPLARDMVVDCLHRKGYTVLTASNGDEAVRYFEMHAAEIALVVTDFGLPVFDGEEVTRRIKRFAPRVPVILMSGFVAPERRTTLIRSGVEEILMKPYNLGQLQRKIREVLDRAPSARP